MSRSSARRAFAGLALAALLAAPARAAGFQEALALQELWDCAWSWLTELWSGERPQSASGSHEEKDLPEPPPAPPNPAPPRPQAARGDQGSGIDPDG